MALNIRPLFADRFAVNNVKSIKELKMSQSERINTKLSLEGETLSKEEKQRIFEVAKNYYEKLLNVLD